MRILKIHYDHKRHGCGPAVILRAYCGAYVLKGDTRTSVQHAEITCKKCKKAAEPSPSSPAI